MNPIPAVWTILQKALNGDNADQLLSDLGLTYTTDAYQDNDGNGTYDQTNHVKYTSDGKAYDSYTLDVDNTKELKNYDVTVKDSTVTLERAKATVDTDKVTTDKVTTDYGKSRYQLYQPFQYGSQWR